MRSKNHATRAAHVRWLMVSASESVSSNYLMCATRVPCLTNDGNRGPDHQAIPRASGLGGELLTGLPRWHEATSPGQ